MCVDRYLANDLSKLIVKCWDACQIAAVGPSGLKRFQLFSEEIRDKD